MPIAKTKEKKAKPKPNACSGIRKWNANVAVNAIPNTAKAVLVLTFGLDVVASDIFLQIKNFYRLDFNFTRLLFTL